MERIYIVINPRGLNVRSKPDTATGQIVRVMATGEAFTATDVFLMRGTETWARLTSGDSVVQQFCMIGQVGRPAHAREQTSEGLPIAAASWQKAIDAWARLKGFDGVKPE